MLNGFLYRQIRAYCSARVEKGEKYSFFMWFEEAEKMLQYCKDKGLTETQFCLEEMIETQKEFLK